MLFMFVTLVVSKNGTEVSERHPLNIEVMFVTLEVSKAGTVVIELQN